MKMEEMMMMMMIRRSPENLRTDFISKDPIPTSTTSYPTWKLYENPFYTKNSNPIHQKQHQQQQHCQGNRSGDNQPKQVHRLQLPISTRKIAASFWDLTFIRPFMESELELARTKVTELKAELEQERKARKKAESTNKKLVRELSEVRKGREALERLCEELTREISSEKAAMNRMHKDMEEERKMLRVSEVLREERVQMKLAEAKLVLEEKLFQLEELEASSSKKCCKKEEAEEDINNVKDDSSSKQIKTGSEEEIKSCISVNDSDSNPSSWVGSQRRGSGSPEFENPHIKRGIKGFVEFPRVVRAIGTKSRHFGLGTKTKLECQKAQLRILLKQNSPNQVTNLISTTTTT